MGIIFSTHLTEDLDKVADYIAMLDKGQLLFCEAREDLFEEKQENFRKLCVYAAVAVTVGLFSMAYRYLKTIREERGGVRRQKAREKEQEVG